MLTAMLFSGGRAALAQVGDSRTLRPRDGRCRQITEDRTIGTASPTPTCSGRRSPRHLNGRPDRSAPTSLRDLRVGDR